ncbi:MAG: DUF2938 family protein [Dehalococcoidia bacterium]
MTPLELAARSAIMGIAGSAAIDAWAFFLRRTFHISSLDYRLLGRWVGHFRSGIFFHARIASAAAVPGERLLGWLAHYGIGVAFAAVLLLAAGTGWANSPSLWPALAVGLGTVLAPWLVMQPAFGAGIAGSKAPRPWVGRLRNLGTHTVYGVGLYVSALGLAAL